MKFKISYKFIKGYEPLLSIAKRDFMLKSDNEMEINQDSFKTSTC